MQPRVSSICKIEKFVYKQAYHSTYIGNKVSKNKLIIIISLCFMIYIFSLADIISQPHLKTLFLRAYNAETDSLE